MLHHDDDGSIWRRVLALQLHICFILMRRKNKQLLLLLLLRYVFVPIGAGNNVRMTHDVVVLQLSINRDVLNALTPHHVDTVWWFQVKNNTRSFCCCNCAPCNTYTAQTIIWISFLNRCIHPSKYIDRYTVYIYIEHNAHTSSFHRTSYTLYYFKCINPHRLDLIAKTVFDIVLPEKFMQSMSYAHVSEHYSLGSLLTQFSR